MVLVVVVALFSDFGMHAGAHQWKCHASIRYVELNQIEIEPDIKRFQHANNINVTDPEEEEENATHGVL